MLLDGASRGCAELGAEPCLSRSLIAQSGPAEYLNDVATADDQNRMAILLDLFISLGVYIRGGDENAELAMTQSGDETRSLPNTYGICRAVALRFQRKLHVNGCTAAP